MTYDVTFFQWITTGTLGPVHLGLTRKEVDYLLGTPEKWGGTSRKRRKPSIYKWGHIELHFHDEILFLLYTDDFDIAPVLNGGSAFRFLDAEQFNRNMTPEQLRVLLNTHDVRFKEYVVPGGNQLGGLQMYGDPETDQSVQMVAPDISHCFEIQPGIRVTFQRRDQASETLGAISVIDVSMP